MSDPEKLGNPYKKLKDIEAERRARIEKSGLKIVGGSDVEEKDGASLQANEKPASFKYPDELLKKPFNPKEPGILDEGE
ncbi:hypothetical protein HYW59_00230 [Candidatus Kaiserbacteria bacterium]|nr:hypothetical protein [Candidatus Kaiserbacteria bacterium]